MSPTTGPSPTPNCSRSTSAPIGSSGSRAWAATRPFPRAPIPLCRHSPSGPGALRVARAHARLGWHWWPATNAILSAPWSGRHPCVQRATCQLGCNEGAKGSTDLTHWPAFVAAGGRLITGACVVAIPTDRAPDWPPAPNGWTRRAGPISRPLTSYSWPPTASAPRGSFSLPPRPATRRVGQLLGARRNETHGPSACTGQRAVPPGPRELAGTFRRFHRVLPVLRQRRTAGVRRWRQVGHGAHRRTPARAR